MFESSLLNALAGDAGLTAILTTYRSAPAIFADSAPEGMIDKVPYIVFRVDKYEGGSVSVDRFNINIDYFDYGPSAANAKAAAQLIDELLDCATLTHDRYDTIRFFRASGRSVPETDPQEIHYNIQYTARAGRKAWMAQL